MPVLPTELIKVFILAFLLLPDRGVGAVSADNNTEHDDETQPLHVAVVGGLTLSGVWPALEPVAEAALGFPIETVVSAPKERIVPAFADGEADLMLVHGGDETFALQALGVALPTPTWAYNEFAIVGPVHDPAAIAGASSGAEAMRRIHDAGVPVVAFRDAGSYTILQRLIEQAGLAPGDFHFIPDTAPRPQLILSVASYAQAYVLVGHIPVAFGRMPTSGVDLLYRGDPVMRRAYVIVRPGPAHPASMQARRRAQQLSDFLLSEDGQARLRLSGPEPGVPWLFPFADAVLPIAGEKQ